MKIKLFLVVFSFLLLGGCASIQEVCSSYGFSEGSESFSNCLMQESQHRQSIRQNAWVNLQQQNRENQRQNQQLYRDIQNSFNRPPLNPGIGFNNRINCSTFNTGGGNSMTSCY